MRNITENLLNSTRNSNLYCVWVPIQDNGRERLVAIWIDRAMTAFKSCAPEIADEIGVVGIAAEQEQREEEELPRCL
jgi:hypothetical protein